MSEIPTKEKIIRSALTLSAQMGWDMTSLREIAEESGLTLAELREYFDDKMDILVGLGRLIDRKTLEAASDPDPESSPRERLFDVLMDRFEVMNEHRDGLLAIIDGLKSEPKQAVISLPFLCQSMNWMLEAAGIEVRGIRGIAQIAGLNALYLNVLRTWAKDESPDLSKTMAVLDKELGRAEKFANMVGM